MAMLENELSPPKPVQRWTAADYAKNGRFVQELAGPLLDMLAPQPGMRILDFGCGDGALTVAIVAGGADVLGVDFSEELRPSLCTGGGEWTADHVRLRFAAELAS
jgi:SAM-dependent methyltransferase